MALRILVVDDETAYRELARIQLERLGHTVVPVATATAAAAALDEHELQLAVIDLNLARRAAGADVAAVLRDAGVPTVVVTASPVATVADEVLRRLPSGVELVDKPTLQADFEALAVRYSRRQPTPGQTRTSEAEGRIVLDLAREVTQALTNTARTSAQHARAVDSLREALGDLREAIDSQSEVLARATGTWLDRWGPSLERYWKPLALLLGVVVAAGLVTGITLALLSQTADADTATQILDSINTGG